MAKFLTMIPFYIGFIIIPSSAFFMVIITSSVPVAIFIDSISISLISSPSSYSSCSTSYLSSRIGRNISIGLQSLLFGSWAAICDPLMDQHGALQLVKRQSIDIYWLLNGSNDIILLRCQRAQYLLNNFDVFHLFAMESHFVADLHCSRVVTHYGLSFVHLQSLKIPSQGLKLCTFHSSRA